MKKLQIVVSLPNDNAYQHEQELVAKSTGERMGLDVQVIHAGDDAIAQSQQVLEIIHTSAESPTWTNWRQGDRGASLSPFEGSLRRSTFLGAEVGKCPALRQSADEIFRLIGAAGSFVLRNLWIRTERARAADAAIHDL